MKNCWINQMVWSGQCAPYVYNTLQPERIILAKHLQSTFWSPLQVPPCSPPPASPPQASECFGAPLLGQGGHLVLELSRWDWFTQELDEDAEKLSISPWWSLEQEVQRLGNKGSHLGLSWWESTEGWSAEKRRVGRGEGQREEVLRLLMDYLQTLPLRSGASPPSPTTHWLFLLLLIVIGVQLLYSVVLVSTI